MKKMAVLAMFVAAMSCVSSRANAQRGMTRITGNVAEAGADVPLAGVHIKALFRGSAMFDTATNETGNWALGGLGKGEWDLLFEKAGYAPRRARVTLPVDLSRVPPLAVTLKKN